MHTVRMILRVIRRVQHIVHRDTCPTYSCMYIFYFTRAGMSIYTVRIWNTRPTYNCLYIFSFTRSGIRIKYIAIRQAIFDRLYTFFSTPLCVVLPRLCGERLHCVQYIRHNIVTVFFSVVMLLLPFFFCLLRSFFNRSDIDSVY